MKTSTIKSFPAMMRIAALLLPSILFIQCVGPMGPRGNDGRDGIDGIDGINYTRTAIYDIQPQDWSGNADGYSVDMTVPEINNAIYYNGAVLVYRLFETEPKSFNLLPYTYVNNALAIYMDYDAYIGKIHLTYKEVYNSVNDTPAPSSTMSFKVVIIDGVQLSALKSLVDIHDYDAVANLVKNFDVGLTPAQPAVIK